MIQNLAVIMESIFQILSGKIFLQEEVFHKNLPCHAKNIVIPTCFHEYCTTNFHIVFCEKRNVFVFLKEKNNNNAYLHL